MKFNQILIIIILYFIQPTANIYSFYYFQNLLLTDSLYNTSTQPIGNYDALDLNVNM